MTKVRKNRTEQINFAGEVKRVLKVLNVAFIDPDCPTYTGDCCGVGTVDPIPTHTYTFAASTNIPNTTALVPPVIPPTLLDGSTHTTLYANGYTVWQYNAGVWTSISIDNTNGPIINP